MTLAPSLQRPFGPTLAAAALLCAAASAAAQDTSRIARVTVYPGVATVERVAKVPAGARSLTLTCLPASLDTQSLQIQADAAVRVGEFSVLTEDRDVASACASPLDGRIRELEDQIAGVKAEAGALQLVDGYLKAVASGPAGDDATAARGPAVTPAQLGAMAEALRKSGQDSQTRAHQLKRRQEALELALKPLTTERDRVASQRARVVSVTVNLAAEREGELRLAYQVRGPGWQPSYRATLDAAKPGVLLERLALVAQNSGEDWSNVQLTLSTGQPNRPTQGRLPRPWTLDVAPPPQPRPPAPAMAMAPAPAAAPLMRERSNGVQEAMPSFDVSTVDKGFATEFAVPQRITVPSNGQRITLALGTHNAPAQLITRTAPGVEEAAYLVAEIAPPPGVWPAGSVGLYRDGAFVGTGRLDFATATATTSGSAPVASLSFGRDELVLVRADAPQDVTGSTGLTGARTERKTRRAYQVENRHRNAIDLQVLHAAPVSRHEKIEVESHYQPAPSDLAWNRQSGTIAWRQSLAAGATAQFNAEHTLRYPKDIELLERP